MDISAVAGRKSQAKRHGEHLNNIQTITDMTTPRDVLEQWLTDRRQSLVVDGEVSSWKSVLSGVPQGSVLGPILFLVYINDLEEGVTGKIFTFSDNTKVANSDD